MRVAVRPAAAMLILALLTTGIGITAGQSDTAQEHVHIENFAFSPQTVTIAAGDSVDWDNHDFATHTATADDNSWSTAFLSNGQSESLVFPDAGTWGYFCQVHPDMRGTLVVNTPPSATIDAPADGSTVDGIVTIAGSANDADGQDLSVQVRVDGGSWQTATGSESWQFTWNTNMVTNGAYSIEARAFDGITYSPLAAITLHVDNLEFVDLQIHDIRSSDAGPMDLLGKQIEITVGNNGNTASGAFQLEVELKREDGPEMLAVIDIGGVAALSQTTRTIDWDATGKVGDFEIVAAADRAGATDDAEPDNNEAEAIVSVVVAGIPGQDPGQHVPGP